MGKAHIMNSIRYIIVLILFIPLRSSAQEIKVIDVADLEKIIHEPSGKVRVINFWATWCKPCIEELPLFESVNSDPAYDNVEVILISLDFVEALDSKVKKFVSEKEINSTVKLLDNVDYNSWINKVDPSWSGAIPATLIVHGRTGTRRFFEKQFEKGELTKELNEFINQL